MLPITLAVWWGLGATAPDSHGEVIARVPVYGVVELSFRGPNFGPTDAPARDVDFWVRFRHESGAPEYRVYGFWDGNGRSAPSGDRFFVRFCPTVPGRWVLVDVSANVPELDGQREGSVVRAEPSEHPGFWVPDPEAAGGRWYRRSDGSHPYIVGNTHYSFLSETRNDGQPTRRDIVSTVRANGRYFKKLRFSIHGDRYPHPTEKPFLDDRGEPTDWGDYSFRPHPGWFRNRVDRAVQAAYAVDLIADLILAGPDTPAARATLRAAHNGEDPTPYLKHIAARYGSYPNVWICLANEFDIKEPSYTEAEIAAFGRTLRHYLPYPTPVSVHAAPKLRWSARFAEQNGWYDHQVIQRKLRDLSAAADAIWEIARRWPYPTFDDELSYQGAGDRHTEGDTIEAHLGAFLGGGCGTTGYKPANKLGQYFWGDFDPQEHTAADNLAWFREIVDREIAFWKMVPLERPEEIFPGLDPAFRAMGWDRQEYVLGTDREKRVLQARLGAGRWRVVRYDLIGKEAVELAASATRTFRFAAPDSRAVLFHFRRVE